MRPVRPARGPAPGHRALSARALLEELGIGIEPQLYELALTHRSYAYEQGGLPHNERLEFLGDAVLGVVVTEYLYRRYPDFAEGRLAKLRAAVVNAHSLADVARSLGLGDELRLGKGELATGGPNKHSILADSLEAVFGAVLISAGRDAADLLLHRLFDPLVDAAVTKGAGLDWKTSLQELCASLDLGLPHYRVSETGPDHDKRFTAAVVVGEQRFGEGRGTSKKQAEQRAAETAFTELVGAGA
ncbi:MAG TPA: ribonuclease III [Propionicimonas sp.]|nr:ribonuclease III [Propionicimonas sp.]